jgi:hypothetical protein
MRYFGPMIALFAIWSLAACDAPAPKGDEKVEISVDVPALVGKSKNEVDAALGTPECPPKNSCVYGDRLEVYFVDNKAANFTLPVVDDLRVYGLKLGEPSFVNTGVKRWDMELAGMPAEVSIFEGNYVYVKTVEP